MQGVPTCKSCESKWESSQVFVVPEQNDFQYLRRGWTDTWQNSNCWQIKNEKKAQEYFYRNMDNETKTWLPNLFYLSKIKLPL